MTGQKASQFWLMENSLSDQMTEWFTYSQNCLIWTPHYYRQFALSPGKETPYIFSTFNLLNTDTQLMQTLSMAPSMSI